MYGTPSELAVNLINNYPAHAKIALIVWTDDDVTECLPDENITPEEAAEITADISSLDSYIICKETIWIKLETMRESAREMQETLVPVRALERVIRLAGEFIRREDIEDGEGAAQRLYPYEIQALEVLRKITER